MTKEELLKHMKEELHNLQQDEVVEELLKVATELRCTGELSSQTIATSQYVAGRVSLLNRLIKTFEE